MLFGFYFFVKPSDFRKARPKNGVSDPPFEWEKVVRKTFVDMLTCCDLPDFVTHSKKSGSFHFEVIFPRVAIS